MESLNLLDCDASDTVHRSARVSRAPFTIVAPYLRRNQRSRFVLDWFGYFELLFSSILSFTWLDFGSSRFLHFTDHLIARRLHEFLIAFFKPIVKDLSNRTISVCHFANKWMLGRTSSNRSFLRVSKSNRNCYRNCLTHGSKSKSSGWFILGNLDGLSQTSTS